MRCKAALLGLGALLFASTPAAAQSLAAAPSSGVIYHARVIRTMEAGDTARPTWIALAAGRIVALGDASQLKAFRARYGFREDRRFDDAVLLPGLIDPHLHPLLAAMLLPMEFLTPEDWDLPDRQVRGTRTEADYERALRAALARAPADAPFFTWGYHPLWHGKWTRARLDAISRTQPIFLWQRSFHEIVTNSAGLALMGLADAPALAAALAGAGANPEHASYAEGWLHETALPLALAGLRAYLFAPAHLAQGLGLLQAMLRQHGVTAIADMATGLFVDVATEWAMLAPVFGNDKTHTRLYLVPAATSLLAEHKNADAAHAWLQERLRAQTGDERVRLLPRIKLLADGAFFAQYMQMNPPGYLDGHEGKWITPPAVLRRQARDFWNKGYALHVHVNGDKGLDVVLDVLDGLGGASARQDFVLEHVGFATNAQVARTRELGATVSMQPNYLYVLGEKYAAHGLGEARARRMAAAGAFVDAGVRLALHSDAVMAPSAPLFLAWLAATRNTMQGGQMLGERALSAREALNAVTRDAAYVLGLEDEIGTLAPGKRADITALAADPLAAGAAPLREIAVVGVVAGGRPCRYAGAERCAAVVEPSGIEPLTSSLRTTRSPD